MTTKDEIVRSQREMASTILGLGRNHPGKNHGRCHANAGSGAEDAPILKLLPKVHNDLTPQGHPQSASGITRRAGDILSYLLGPVIHLETPRQEDKSTEEVLSQLTEAQ